MLYEFGALDGIVLNHAYSTQDPIGKWTANHIDQHLHTSVRAAMLLIQSFSNQLPRGKRGAITIFTSGKLLVR